MYTTIVGTLIAAVLAFIAGVWVERRRRSYEARHSHMAKLKDGVIRPLLHQLKHYYLPVCANERSNIIGKSVLVSIPDAPLTEFNASRQDKLVGFTVADIVEDWQQQDVMRDFDARIPLVRDNLAVDQELYGDIRNSHETGLIERWETFVSRVEEYDHQCLKHVENVAHLLVLKSSVPDWTDQPLRNNMKHGVNAAGIASYVWARQLGVSSLGLVIGGRDDSFQVNAATETLAMGTEREMRRILPVVEELLADKSGLSALQALKSQLKLEETANLMVHELKIFELSNKLRGKCTYIKV